MVHNETTTAVALDETKCVRIQELFALAHESRVIQLYLDRIAKEMAGKLTQREIERLDALASATITLIEESECVPCNHLVSLNPDPGIAKSIDGKAANFAISDVSLKKVAGCACSIAHEMDPKFGYYVTHLDTISGKEYEHLDDIVHPACALLLYHIISF